MGQITATYRELVDADSTGQKIKGQYSPYEFYTSDGWQFDGSWQDEDVDETDNEIYNTVFTLQELDY